MKRSEVHARYKAEVDSIRSSGETHPQGIAMAMNEARRWYDRELDLAEPDDEEEKMVTKASINEVTAARIATEVRKRAEDKRTDAGYSGSWDDGGAKDDVEKLEMWLMGIRGQVPKEYQEILEMACAEAQLWTTAKYDAQNPAALRRLVASGTQLRPFTREVLEACYKAAYELYDETAATNAKFSLRPIPLSWLNSLSNGKELHNNPGWD